MAYDIHVARHITYKMKKLLIIAAVTVLMSAVSSAQKPKYIGMKSAKITALRVAPGKIEIAEREREHGKMIYSFDVMTYSGERIEVNIDAITGDVISTKPESAEDEAREKAGKKNKETDDQD